MQRVAKAWAVMALIVFIVVTRSAVAANPPSASANELTVVTFNVMVDVTPTPGVPGWEKRKVLCAARAA